VSESRYEWAATGDVNAFFGLMLDNIADLLLTVSLLAFVFEFPTDFALQNMVPGTAIGVLVGDLLFFWMALRLARKTGRNNITAMPLGLDTPSTFGMVFFVLGPAFTAAKETMTVDQAAIHTWHIGICAIFVSGLFKFVCAGCSNWIRRVVPRAGLLGSLAAVALVLISFIPLLEVLHYPIVGLVALAVILTTLIARIPLPGRVPGALGAMLVGAVIYYIMQTAGILGAVPEPEIVAKDALLPSGWLTVFTLEWTGAFEASLRYWPLVIPFALATVIGGIDCTESAAAVGDEFNTNHVIGVEAFATLVASLCGGVIQTTPYIGHPAYKAMGGRAAYTLATALFVGSAGLLGYFGYLYLIIPKATVFPILIFVGLEITAQSFRATPRRHYTAIAIACVPAMAALVLIYVDDLQGQYMGSVAQLNQTIERIGDSVAADANLEPLKAEVEALRQRGETLEMIAGNPASGRIGEPFGPLGKNLHTLRLLAGGFIVTSLLWASAVVALMDRRLKLAAAYFAVAAACSLVGIIHSPMPGSPLVNPFSLPDNLPHNAEGQTPLYMAAAYGCVCLLLLGWDTANRWLGVVVEPLEEEPIE
jgi:AGZA family xanthine/uracil permease-like MFS transporter